MSEFSQYLVIVRNPERAPHGQKGKLWELVRNNFVEAAGLAERPPSIQALKRRLAALLKAKVEQLSLYRSGATEDFDEIDRLLEEYLLITKENEIEEVHSHLFSISTMSFILYRKIKKKISLMKKQGKMSMSLRHFRYSTSRQPLHSIGRGKEAILVQAHQGIPEKEMQMKAMISPS